MWKYLTRPRTARMFAVCAALSFAMSSPVMATETKYPSRPVKIVVAMPPGGGLDTTARHIANELSHQLGQSFIIENRPGGNGFIAANAVAKAAPDGYTLWLSSNSPMVTNPAIFRQLPYDPVADFTPVARLLRLPMVVAVPASSPHETLDSLMTAARAAPGSLNYASGSSTYHVVTELINERHQVQAHAVPYKGTAPAITDLAAGHVDYAVGEINSVLPLANSGKVRLLAVTSAKRLETLPQVPTVSESGAPGFDLDAWIGMYGPANLPEDIVATLAKAVDTALRAPAIVETIRAMHGAIDPSGPQVLRDFQAAEYERARKIVQSANIPLQ